MKNNRNFFSVKNVAWVENDSIHVSARYSEAFVQDCREIDGRQWHAATKTNVFPIEALPMVKVLAERWGIIMPTELLESDKGNYYNPNVDPRQMYLADDKIVICFNYDPKKIQKVKTFIPGVAWSAKNKNWTAPMSSILQALLFAHQEGLLVEPTLFDQGMALQREAMALQEASSALTGEIEIPNMAQELLPYQKAGVLYLKKVRKAILGDQPGLGKTVQAIATVASENQFPVVVVCPNTLKLNWEREVKKFFPHLTVQVLSGTKSCTIEKCDVVVVNYDILYERNPDIFAHGFKALIVDESHAIKNGQKKHFCPHCEASVRSNAVRCQCTTDRIKPIERWTVKRASAVMELAKSLDKNQFVLLLTGTPITNRPDELIPQLEAIDKLGEFGGVWRFKNRYAPKRNIATNTKELNDKLRSMCFVRRVKSDVYGELPPLRNALQYLEISDKNMKTYRAVETDVIEYFAQRAKNIAEETGDDADQAYWQKRITLEFAENLVKITGLRDVVSKIKLDAIIDWLDNFLESSNNEKVIVFAEHIDFVESIYARYQNVAVKIRGGVSVANRQEAVDRFQNDPECRMFVANMTSASEGLTLTAASDVVFCELAWTPAMHEQCASRAYGRANDLHGATAWYLLAPTTIDEEIYSLLERKKKVINAVTDGIETEDEGSVIGQLVVSLAKRGMK